VKKANKKIVTGYYTPMTIHDHFGGYAHCVECEGSCRLTGAELGYTALVRALFEGEWYGAQPIPHAAVGQLAYAGLDVRHFRERVKAMGTVG
jgi:hypothetical protein